MCALIALVSCQKRGDLNLPENQNKMRVMAAIDNGGQTKTTAQAEGDVTKVLWAEDDAFAMSVKGGDFAKFVLASGAGSQVGTFEPEGAVAEGESTGYVAYYPYAAGITYAEGKLGVNFPAEQSYTANSIAAAPMVAISETEDLRFVNVASLVKITLQGDATIKKITLTGNNDDVLAGAAEVTVGETPVLTLAAGADAKVITLDCGEGVALTEEGVDFYFALPAVTLEKGFTIKAVDADGTHMIKSTNVENAVVLTASKVKVYPPVEYAVTWEEVADEEALKAAFAAGSCVKLTEDITLTDYIELRSAEVVLDLNGKDLVHPASSAALYKDVIEVYTGGVLTIVGDGELRAEDGYCIYAAGDAVVNINSGNYYSVISAVDARKNATVTINAGVFKVDPEANPSGNQYGHTFTLNLRDKTGSYTGELANIIVKGGEYLNYNPAASESEPTTVNFVAEGYMVVNKADETQVLTLPHNPEGEDIWYKVVAE